jgi:hypothetical protein
LNLLREQWETITLEEDEIQNSAAIYADDMFSLGSDTSGDEDDNDATKNKSGNGEKDENNDEKKGIAFGLGNGVGNGIKGIFGGGIKKTEKERLAFIVLEEEL